MTDRDREALEDILKAIRRVQGFPIPERETFLSSDYLQDAVVRNLEIIGEATKRLSDNYRNDHPGIPWRQMAGMRDVVVHQYFGIEVKTVWNAATVSVPNVLKVLMSGSP